MAITLTSASSSGGIVRRWRRTMPRISAITSPIGISPNAVPGVLRQQNRQVVAQPRPIGGSGGAAEPDQGAIESIRILPDHGDQQRPLLAQLVVESADLAEVDDSDLAGWLDEEVPRMRIGVGDGVLEHHLGGDAHRPLSKGMPIDSCRVEGRAIGWSLDR
jgi:hypothetical protein